MDFSLTDEHLIIRDAARDFAQTELLPGVIERDNKDQLRRCKEFRKVTKTIMKQVTKYFYSKSTPCLRRNYT